MPCVIGGSPARNSTRPRLGWSRRKGPRLPDCVFLPLRKLDDVCRRAFCSARRDWFLRADSHPRTCAGAVGRAAGRLAPPPVISPPRQGSSPHGRDPAWARGVAPEAARVEPDDRNGRGALIRGMKPSSEFDALRYKGSRSPVDTTFLPGTRQFRVCWNCGFSRERICAERKQS